MRKYLSAAVSVVAIIGLVAPAAFAQAPAAPASKVTIQGLVDNVVSAQQNMSINDLDLAKRDHQFRARTRVRPDIIGQVGDAKFVLGMEFDYSYGQASASTDQIGSNGLARGSVFFGESASSSINTDIGRLLEIKWAYTEVPLPFMPWKTIMRFGAQPFDVTYKQSIYANSDFPGFHLSTQFTPGTKLNLTYAFISDRQTGRSDGFLRGESGAVMIDPEITPFKGLNLRPLYSYMFLTGVPTNTYASPRIARGGVANNFCTPAQQFGPNGAQSGSGVAGTLGTTAASSTLFITNGNLTGLTGAPPCFTPGSYETRHTFGLDAQWRLGPFSLDPTFLYQIGHRQLVGNVVPAAMGTFVNGIATLQHTQREESWIADIRGGFQAGPLLLEAAAIYTPGNKATEDVRDPRRGVSFYQPLSTDAAYYTTWAEVWALGIEYLQMIRAGAAGLAPGTSIGYDKYGLGRIGARATYALTPSFSVRTNVTANWTAESVDTTGNLTANGIVPCTNNATLGVSGCNGLFKKGDHNYLGTEWDLGFTYKFAPGVTLDVVGAYMWSGPALAAAEVTSANGGDGVNVVRTNPPSSLKDIQTIVARVRYAF